MTDLRGSGECSSTQARAVIVQSTNERFRGKNRSGYRTALNRMPEIASRHLPIGRGMVEDSGGRTGGSDGSAEAESDKGGAGRTGSSKLGRLPGKQINEEISVRA